MDAVLSISFYQRLHWLHLRERWSRAGEKSAQLRISNISTGDIFESDLSGFDPNKGTVDRDASQCSSRELFSVDRHCALKVQAHWFIATAVRRTSNRAISSDGNRKFGTFSTALAAARPSAKRPLTVFRRQPWNIDFATDTRHIRGEGYFGDSRRAYARPYRPKINVRTCVLTYLPRQPRTLQYEHCNDIAGKGDAHWRDTFSIEVIFYSFFFCIDLGSAVSVFCAIKFLLCK